VNLLGGGSFQFPDAIEIDPELRRRILKLEVGP
jgi:hypothetical protein